MPSSQADARFDACIGVLEDMLLEQSFLDLQQSFLATHAAAFSPDEENKLEYTLIFNAYTTQVEAYISARLVERLEWFNMKAFMQMLVYIIIIQG